MMMQLQAGVNFSCLKTFALKNECIYLYISWGFKIFANSCIYHICTEIYRLKKREIYLVHKLV